VATLTYADLIAKFRELASDSADEQTRIGVFLDVAEETIGDVFRTTDRRDLARLLYAAHLTILAARNLKHGGSGMGAITSRTNADGETVSYQAPAPWVGGFNNLGSTRYGVALAPLLMSARYRRPVLA